MGRTDESELQQVIVPVLADDTPESLDDLDADDDDVDLDEADIFVEATRISAVKVEVRSLG